ncbi:hypothetical protein FLAV_02026 [Flavobacteriales bacterium]|nr:hypothetical protein [Bacteroidota bacterium]GIK69749.1 MAG: hypothetical protein BroJett020_10440 [Bacteroidota bacterium]CAG0985763.1 hypothetical protein FLAV_02026 [Flavobacteriales bacterium]
MAFILTLLNLKLMKKVILFVAVAAFAATTFTSCKKNWTCECCVDILGTKTCAETTAKMTKKDAKVWCEDNSNNICKLK